MILEALVPQEGRRWALLDITTAISVILVCRRWHAIMTSQLRDLRIDLDAGPHALSARMTIGPPTQEWKAPSFCRCYREYCACMKDKTHFVHSIGLFGSIRSPVRLTIHIQSGTGIGLPHIKVLDAAVALFDKHKVDQLEIAIVIWTTMEKARYSFTSYTSGLYGVLRRCSTARAGRENRIVHIAFRGPDIQLDYPLRYSQETSGNQFKPWPYINFQKFVGWQDKVSIASAGLIHVYDEILEALMPPMSEVLEWGRSIEHEDYGMRLEIGMARKLGII